MQTRARTNSFATALIVAFELGFAFSF